MHPRALEQLGIVWQLGEAKLRQAMLPRPDQLPLSPQLEIDLGQPKAIGGALKRAQAGRLSWTEQQAQ
jgi:hypothetical protein